MQQFWLPIKKTKRQLKKTVKMTSSVGLVQKYQPIFINSQPWDKNWWGILPPIV